MKRTLFALCTAGLLLCGLVTPALGAYIGNTRPGNIPLSIAGAAQPAAPDAAGTVSFRNLEARLREKNTTVRSLQAALTSHTIVDRERAYENTVDAINGMADYAWWLSQDPMTKDDAKSQVKAAQMQSAADSLSDQLEALKPENYEKNMELLRRQMGSAMWQIITGAEGLYLSILTYEANLADLNNAIKTLESTLSEMTLRHDLGQVSTLTLQQLQATYQATKSQAASLELGIKNMKAALENMLGETITGSISLSPIPSVSKAQLALAAQDYDTSLRAAKAKSAAVYAADKALDDAKEDWKDISDSSSVSEKYQVAEQTYQSAIFTHDAAIKNFELSFRNLYQAIPGAKQALTAARSTLRYQQESYNAAELRHQLGQLSDTALSTAKNELLSAQSAVSAAERSLFAAYRNFECAILYGLAD